MSALDPDRASGRGLLASIVQREPSEWTTSQTPPEISRASAPGERALVLRVASRYLHDADDAADATQDALLIAFRHGHSFRGDSQFTTWLYRIASTTALMRLRGKRRSGQRFDFVDPEMVARVPSPALDPEARAIVLDQMDCIARHLARLGPIYARVISMRFGEGYSSPDIGRRLGLEASTVKTRASRGRRKQRAAAAGCID